MQKGKLNLEPKVDAGFAPKGYKAVPDISKHGCVGCAFYNDTQCGPDRKCGLSERPDKQSVIFVADEQTQLEAELNALRDQSNTGLFVGVTPCDKATMESCVKAIIEACKLLKGVSAPIEASQDFIAKKDVACPSCGGMKMFHTDHVPGGFETCKTCEGKGTIPLVLSKGELMKIVSNAAIRYKASGIKESLRRNKHMHDAVVDSDYRESLADAILVDFINYLGMEQGLDYGMYTKDLTWEGYSQHCSYRMGNIDACGNSDNSIGKCEKKGCPKWVDPV